MDDVPSGAPRSNSKWTKPSLCAAYNEQKTKSIRSSIEKLKNCIAILNEKIVELENERLPSLFDDLNQGENIHISRGNIIDSIDEQVEILNIMTELKFHENKEFEDYHTNILFPCKYSRLWLNPKNILGMFEKTRNLSKLPDWFVYRYFNVANIDHKQDVLSSSSVDKIST